MSSKPGFCQLFFKTENREKKERETVRLPPDCVQTLGITFQNRVPGETEK